MSETTFTPVRIGALNLQLPGTDAASGRQIAAGVGRALAQGLSDPAAGHRGRLAVRVQVARGAGPAEVAEAVARAILQATRQQHG